MGVDDLSEDIPVVEVHLVVDGVVDGVVVVAFELDVAPVLELAQLVHLHAAILHDLRLQCALQLLALLPLDLILLQQLSLQQITVLL